jgi:hypothetical protein
MTRNLAVALIAAAALGGVTAAAPTADAALLLKIEFPQNVAFSNGDVMTEANGGFTFESSASNVVESLVQIDTTTFKPPPENTELVSGILQIALSFIPPTPDQLFLKASNNTTIYGFTSAGQVNGNFIYRSELFNTGGPGASNIEVTLIPLPAALPLLASGLLGLWGVSGVRSRRQRANEAIAA